MKIIQVCLNNLEGQLDTKRTSYHWILFWFQTLQHMIYTFVSDIRIVLNIYFTLIFIPIRHFIVIINNIYWEKFKFRYWSIIYSNWGKLENTCENVSILRLNFYVLIRTCTYDRACLRKKYVALCAFVKLYEFFHVFIHK